MPKIDLLRYLTPEPPKVPYLLVPMLVASLGWGALELYLDQIRKGESALVAYMYTYGTFYTENLETGESQEFEGYPLSTYGQTGHIVGWGPDSTLQDYDLLKDGQASVKSDAVGEDDGETYLVKEAKNSAGNVTGVTITSLDPHKPFEWTLDIENNANSQAVSEGGFAITEVVRGADGIARTYLKWDSKHGQQSREIQPAVVFALSPDGTKLLVLSSQGNGGYQLWHLPARDSEAITTQEIDFGREVTMGEMYFVHDGLIVACMKDLTTGQTYLYLLDAETLKPTDEVLHFEDYLTYAEISASGRSLVVTTRDLSNSADNTIRHIGIEPDGRWGFIRVKETNEYVNGAWPIEGARASENPRTRRIGWAVFTGLTAAGVAAATERKRRQEKSKK